MNRKQIIKIGLVILVLGIMLTGYGGLCKKSSDDDDVIITGSSGNPVQVTTPSPANGATSVPITSTLTWAMASGATSYDVYFGITSTGWTLITNTTDTIYNPGTLSTSATYYWRIDFKNSVGTTTGNVWSFQTGAQTWTKQLGTSTDDVAHGVATDDSGNIYVAGHTYGNLGDVNPNAGSADLFVVKYNIDGVKQWARQLGTDAYDTAYGVATDTSDNIYVVGYTSGVISSTIPTGGVDLFVVKYNTDGVKQWARQLGTTVDDYAMDVATDTSDNIYVVGYTWGVISSTTPTGGVDLFVVKYNTDGVKQWARQLGTTADDQALDVAIDTSGAITNIYVAGCTSGVISATAPTGMNDLFVVKYNTDGVKQWTRQLGTTNADDAYGVATDTSGNIYVAGYTWGVISSTSPTGGFDLFVVKYNSAGAKQWARQLGTTVDDQVLDVAIDPSDNICVVGYTAGNLAGTNAGGDDLFVVKYNSAGAKQWARQLGTANVDEAFDVATDTSGNIYVVGDTKGGLDGHTNTGLYDFFVVKYNSAGEKQ